MCLFYRLLRAKPLLTDLSLRGLQSYGLEAVTTLDMEVDWAYGSLRTKLTIWALFSLDGNCLPLDMRGPHGDPAKESQRDMQHMFLQC